MQTFAFIFLANTLAASMTATGAFEVLYGEEVVFSKLAMGRMPTGDVSYVIEWLIGWAGLGWAGWRGSDPCSYMYIYHNQTPHPRT